LLSICIIIIIIIIIVVVVVVVVVILTLKPCVAFGLLHRIIQGFSVFAELAPVSQL
jgi:hypothetical protein